MPIADAVDNLLRAAAKICPPNNRSLINPELTAQLWGKPICLKCEIVGAIPSSHETFAG
jgi:hypothetical protein